MEVVGGEPARAGSTAAMASQDGESVRMNDRRGRDKPGDERRDEPAVLRAARDHTGRGWCVVPLKAGSKKPAGGRGWQHVRLAEKDLNRHFPPRANQGVGVQTGRASRGLMDVDCDTSDAIAAAPLLLPPTGLVHGRASKPASHYWYAVEETLAPTPRPTRAGSRR